MGQNNCITKRGGYKHFTETQRYKLEGLLEAKLPVFKIAEKLDKHKATVYREIKRGSLRRIGYCLEESTVYRANVAEKDYKVKVVNRERSLKIGKDKTLEEYIRKKLLINRYSPDAIIGEIKLQRIKFKGMICTKTLYSYISRGIFSGITDASLWEKRKIRKRKHKKIKRIGKIYLMPKRIDQRPREINNRIEYGHWEGDCIKSPVKKGKESLFTLTERLTREEIIIKIQYGRQSEILQSINGLEVKYGTGFTNKFKTMTFDNGVEFLDWEAIEESFLRKGLKRTQVYFAHPYSAWERGSNENHNRMIRRFIPKGRSIATVTEVEIKEIENWMNNYPRKILGYKTPNQLVLELAKNRFRVLN
jgi:transposase, IS30 family